MLSAKTAAVTSSKAPKASTSEYLEGRITGASAKGYSSTKAWLRLENYDEAKQLLAAGGYTYVEIGTEPGKVQLDISWS